jgi:Fe-S-cluster-containing hydrogenase component 2|tara:strand:+ start:786 stop:2837 length:2052 start_codon:yes stop_codon:yes gene_type:complete
VKKLKLAKRWDERLEKVRLENQTAETLAAETQAAEQKDSKSSEVQETEAEKEFNETDLKTIDESTLTALEDLGSESDYTQFMSSEVSESIRKLALRKFFSGAEFNITDGLDDYDEDYTSFAALGNVITQEMKLKQKTKLEKRAKEMDENVEARKKAFAAVGEDSVEPTSMVPLLSSGNLLIIGKDETPIMQALTSLKESQLITSVLRIGRGDEEDFDGIKVIYSQNLDVKISGHLGDFTVTLETPQGNMNIAQVVDNHRENFDLILDLNTTSLSGADTKPLGYYAPEGDEDLLRKALEALPEQIGEFEKPVFLQYDANICAHNRSEQTGCQRCLEACPTLAITSKGEAIDVDNYLCQGGGVCATVCPTGALKYVFPRPEDMGNRIRTLLTHFREAGGDEPWLLFYGEEAGAERIKHIIDSLPGNILAIEVEEVGSIGLEIWLSSFAFGAKKVLLLDSYLIPESVENLIQNQVKTAKLILQGLGFAESCINWIGRKTELTDVLLEKTKGMPKIAEATYFALSDKRKALFYALDHLYECSQEPQEMINLPQDAAFGQVHINTKSCTLCLSCAAICPTSALTAGGDHPRLNFQESLCVQCGLCESACPEKIVSLERRILLSPELRKDMHILNEEEPFCCLNCGKAFSTPSMIEMITGRLAGHAMFSAPGALDRLKMCEDCRVKDMF